MPTPSVHTLRQRRPGRLPTRCPGCETLALTVVAGRGARSEDEAESGWAHLLEHMVFKGAGERSARDIVEVIEAAGRLDQRRHRLRAHQLPGARPDGRPASSAWR